MTQDIAHSEATTVKANGIDIVYDTFGNQSAPPLLLIMGLGGQMIDWDDQFCRQLAAAGYWVIRFDNRDIGLSTKFDEAGVPDVMGIMQSLMMGQAVEVPYLLTDMADDAAGLLAALEIESAHILGISMGGMIAQTVAIHHRQRVRTLISIMSSTGEPSLPQPKPEVMALLTTPAPTERAAYLDYSVQTWRMLGGPGFPFDEAQVRERAGHSFDRGLNPAGFARQMAAILASGSRKEALAGVKIPTLVIHGKADPLIPVEGGIDTAESIPGAKLMLIDGMGHDLPVDAWPQIIEAVARQAR